MMIGLMHNLIINTYVVGLEIAICILCISNKDCLYFKYSIIINELQFLVVLYLYPIFSKYFIKFVCLSLILYEIFIFS